MCWHILDKLFEHGAMPTLQRLIKKSARGILESSIPPVSPTAWTCMATGVNPGKHGVFDFITTSEDYKSRILNSYEVQYPRIHEMVALKGMVSVCINQAFTYPIIQMEKASVISDWLAPKMCYYPKYLRNFVSTYKSIPRSVTDLSTIHEDCEGRVNSVNAIMEQCNWDLFWVVYTEPDHIFHAHFDQVLKGSKLVAKIFNKIDETIRKASKKTNLLLIVSDHGFQKYRYTTNINSFLDNIGLVTKTWKKPVKELGDLAPAKRATHVRTVKLPKKIHKIVLGRPLTKFMAKKIYRMFTGKEIAAIYPYAEPKQSKAFMYSHSSFGIHVNQENLIDFIIEELSKQKYISHVWRREYIYSGPYVNKAPHIIFTPNFDEGFTMAGSTRIAPTVISKGTVYWHHPHGLIIAHGESIKPQIIDNANVVDVAPTILNYLGLPLPIDVDGEPIPSIASITKLVKHYNYVNHWKLIKQVQTAKIRLAKQI